MNHRGVRGIPPVRCSWAAASTPSVKKGAGEAGHSDSLYFYLLLYGDFAGAKTIATDDEAAKEITAYVIASYFKLALSDADEKEIEELRSKYGTMREFRNALAEKNRQNNP